MSTTEPTRTRSADRRGNAVGLSVTAKEAIKTALAMTLAYGVALSEGWDKPMWAGFAVAFVSLGTIGQSVDKAALRMLGSFSAAAVSFVLLGCFPQDRWLFCLALSSWVGYCAYRIGGSRYPYFWQVSAFVAVIVSLEAGFSASNAFHVAVLRIQETGLGVLIYTLVSLLLWPANAGPKMLATARELLGTQRQLFDACIDLIRVGDVRAARALRAKANRQQRLLQQLLDAATTDSLEVHERQAEWRMYQQQSAALTEAMERCCDALFGHAEPNADRLLPSLRAFQREIASRLTAIADMLGAEPSAHAPAEISLHLANEKDPDVTHFQRAVLTAANAQLLEIERITRGLYATAHGIVGGAEPRAGYEPPKRSPGFAYDPDRFLAVTRVMLIQWLSYLVLIYVPAIPGGVGVAILAGSMGIAAANAPQLSMFKLIAPGLVSTAFAGAIYLLVMPHLTTFVGLGAVIFAATWAICFLFAAPQQALGRALGLAMFAAVTSISNEQSYSFVSVATTALMLPIGFSIVAAASYVPLYLRPDRMTLRLLAQFFRSCAYAARAVLSEEPTQAAEDGGWQQAFHVRELATIPAKIEAWKPWVVAQALPRTSPDQIQALADSSAFLSRAVSTLVERAAQPGSPHTPTPLGEEIRAWHFLLTQALAKLADDPTAGREDMARERLAETREQIEARAREALDASENDADSLEKHESLYLLLAAYRSVSEALVDYIQQASAIDWTPWREERFT